MRDLISNLKNTLNWAAVVNADEIPTNGIDLQGFFAAEVLAAIGTVTNAAPTVGWTFHLEHSDDDVTYTPVTDIDVLLDHGKNDGALGTDGLFATVDGEDADDTVYSVGYAMSKRYVRTVAKAVNTPGDTPIATVVVAGSPALAPVDD